MTSDRSSIAAKVVRMLFAAMLVAGLAPIIALSQPGRAYAATTGMTGAGRMEITYGVGEQVHGSWHEGFLNVDGANAWCIDPNSDFQAGVWVTAMDAVGSGRISQDCMTDIALAVKYITEGNYYTSSGWYATSSEEQYALIQVYVWWIMHNYGYNSYGWFGAALDGHPLTGYGDSANLLWDYIAANRGQWIGHGTVYDAASSQDVMAGIGLTPAKGYLDLLKQSANPDMTTENPCYDLSGAVYGVYGSEADANAGSNAVATFTTDADGNADAVELDPDTYYVKETTAPEGYETDQMVYECVVNPGETTWVNGGTVDDVPYSDPITAFVYKADPVTGGTAQGGATLAGAQFTVKYYADYYDVDPATLGVEPTRTWVMQTDEDGYCRFAEKYIVSGDSYYYDVFGNPAFPIGTVTVQETKAPEGYHLSTDLYPNTVFVQKITTDGIEGDMANQWNEHEFLDQVKASECYITKIGTRIGDDVVEGDAAQAVPLEGVEFSLYPSADFDDNGDGSYTLHDDANAYAVITTDENGIANTHYIDRPDGQSGALPYDTYLVVETGPAANYDPIDPYTFDAHEDGKTYTFLANNTYVTAGVAITKADAESGLPILVPGAVFQILDADGDPIVWSETYPEQVDYTDLVVGETGTIMLPDKLNAGSYSLHEVSAPEGYVLGKQDIPFTVDATTGWDEPLAVSYPDKPQKGTVSISKADERTGDAVAGAVYHVVAAEDIATGDGVVHAHAGDVVAELVTGDDGTAESGELYLGDYIVVEVESPEGYAIDTEEHPVSLEYEGQDVELTHAHLDLVDGPTVFGMAKQAEQVDDTLAAPLETEWLVWAEDADGNRVFEERAVTDDEGRFEIAYIPHGDGYTYYYQEVRCDDDWILDPEVHSFEVDADGLIDGEPAYIVEAVNYHKRIIEVDKVDASDGGPVPGVWFALDVWSGEGMPVEMGGDDADGEWEGVASELTGEDGTILFDGLPMGYYRLTEVAQSPDYMSPEESGEDRVRYIECSPASAVAQVQVIGNKPLTVSTTVDKSTIDKTSAGLVYTDENGDVVSNVGSESYRYDVSFASTSNVYGDEYWVVDECQMVESPYDMRIGKMLLPVVEGDTDGMVSVLVMTNKTGEEGTAAGMNFAQPELHEGTTLCDGTQRFDPTGWDFVGEFPAGSRIEIDLGSALEDGEYVTGVALCYGAVEVGFGTVEPLSYLVSATHPLEEGTVIPNTATSHISRNWSSVDRLPGGDVPKEGGPAGPHDDAVDDVETVVLSTFGVEYTRSLDSMASMMPKTGDIPIAIAVAAAFAAVAGGCVAATAAAKARGKKAGRR